MGPRKLVDFDFVIEEMYREYTDREKDQIARGVKELQMASPVLFNDKIDVNSSATIPYILAVEFVGNPLFRQSGSRKVEVMLTAVSIFLRGGRLRMDVEFWSWFCSRHCDGKSWIIVLMGILD